MDEICLNDVLDAISVKINEIFGNKYTIYSNEIKQGFQTPCFYIKVLPESRTKKLGPRYQMNTSFVIHTFLDEPTVEELNDIGHQLYQLEEININDNVVIGTGMRTEIVDNVLEFFIDYNFFVFTESIQTEVMVDFVITEEVKDGETNY